MGTCPICHKQFVDRLYQKNGKCSQCGQSITDYLRNQENMKVKETVAKKKKINQEQMTESQKGYNNSTVNSNENFPHKQVRQYRKVNSSYKQNTTPTTETENRKSKTKQDDDFAQKKINENTPTDIKQESTKHFQNNDKDLDEDLYEDSEVVCFTDEDLDQKDYNLDNNDLLESLDDNMLTEEDAFLDETIENEDDEDEFSLDNVDDNDFLDDKKDQSANDVTNEKNVPLTPAERLHKMLEKNKNRTLIEKECDMEFAFNSDGFYDDKLPDKLSEGSGFNMKYVFYVLLAFMGLILLALALIYYA